MNVALRLRQAAAEAPDRMAVAQPLGRRRPGRKRRYATITFAELERDSNRIASGLQTAGFPPQARIVLMVRPSVDFISLVFALLKSGVTMVLIDPGMGRKNLVRCLEDVKPDGFVAIPLAHAIRTVLRKRFPHAKHNVTVGRRWFWGGKTLEQIRQLGTEEAFEPQTLGDDPAAIIFTTGSTGPPKGVLYEHRNFDQQVEQLGERYQIQAGEIDLPGFPLFGLFNCAMGVSTVIPDMDPTRPADVDPENILEAAADWQVTQCFGSPALWNTVSKYCEQHDKRFTTLRRVLSAGAPVPPHVIERVLGVTPDDAELYTPYGATESLPVASISGREVLNETAPMTKQGRGVCVGTPFSGIDWKVIAIDDGPLETIEQTRELPIGEIGELMVRGDVVTRRYVTAEHANAAHKVADGQSFWHRMGDVGYLEETPNGQRFWFCGRKSHRLQTASGPLFTIPCESIFNNHPKIYRSALVGVGDRPEQIPVLIAEPWPEHWPEGVAHEQLMNELLAIAGRHELTRSIQNVLLHPKLPTDIRHNSKIFREQLVGWAAERLALLAVEQISQSTSDN